MSLDSAEPEVTDQGNKKMYTYTYSCKGIENDSVISVDGIYMKASLIIVTNLPKSDFTLKDSAGKVVTPTDSTGSSDKVTWNVIVGNKYTLEIANASNDKLSIVDSKYNKELEPKSTGATVVYDITDVMSNSVGYTNSGNVVALSVKGASANSGTSTVPEKGKPVEPTNSKGKFEVVDNGSEGSKPEVKFIKPEKSAANVTIPETIKDSQGNEYSVTEIDSNAFKNDKKLTKVTIPATVETIGKGAFSGCKKLTTVKIGKNVDTIGQNAFANCTKLKKVEVPKAVTKIGKGAFSGCKSLKTITIKSTEITKIDSKAFKGLDKKATIKVPKNKKKAYTNMLKKAGFKGKIK